MSFALIFSAGVFIKSHYVTASEITAALEALIQKEINNGEMLSSHTQFNNTLLGALKYELLELDRLQNSVTMRFIYIDAMSLADKYSGITNANKYYNAASADIISGSAETVTQDICFNYSVTSSLLNKAIELQMNDDLLNALSGGTYFEYLRLMEVIS